MLLGYGERYTVRRESRADFRIKRGYMGGGREEINRLHLCGSQLGRPCDCTRYRRWQIGLDTLTMAVSMWNVVLYCWKWSLKTPSRYDNETLMNMMSLLLWLFDEGNIFLYTFGAVSARLCCSIKWHDHPGIGYLLPAPKLLVFHSSLVDSKLFVSIYKNFPQKKNTKGGETKMLNILFRWCGGESLYL